MPGTTIRERTAQVARGLPTDTGVLFLAGPSERGTVDVVRNLDDFIDKFGGRVSYSLAYDMVEAFFRTGGQLMYFSRIMGVTPVAGDIDLVDDDDEVSITLTARSPGEWVNTRNVEVAAGDASEIVITITDDDDDDINETTPSFATQAEIVAWFDSHADFVATVGASTELPEVAAAAPVAGGTDDIGTMSDATALIALNRFNKRWGPGQVAFAGRATTAAKGQLADHGAANNRVALYDTTDTTSKVTLLSEGDAVNGLANAKHGALFGPWVDIPGLNQGGSYRAIPASAVVAGVIAANDVNNSANEPAAGENGLIPWIIGPRAVFSDDDADDINEGSVNLIREIAGDFRVYGYRSGANKSADQDWWQFGNVRLYMEIASLADNILEKYVLKQITRHRLADLENDLTLMLLPYFEDGSLYGDTPGEAFFADTGPSVNTDSPDGGTIGQGEIHAVIELTMSPMGENVVLDIVKKRIGS